VNVDIKKPYIIFFAIFSIFVWFVSVGSSVVPQSPLEQAKTWGLTRQAIVNEELAQAAAQVNLALESSTISLQTPSAKRLTRALPIWVKQYRRVEQAIEDSVSDARKDLHERTQDALKDDLDSLWQFHLAIEDLNALSSLALHAFSEGSVKLPQASEDLPVLDTHAAHGGDEFQKLFSKNQYALLLYALGSAAPSFHPLDCIRQYPHLCEAIEVGTTFKQIAQASNLPLPPFPFVFQDNGKDWLVVMTADSYCLGGGRPGSTRLRPESYEAKDCSSFIAQIFGLPKDITTTRLVACFVDHKYIASKRDCLWGIEQKKTVQEKLEIQNPKSLQDLSEGMLMILCNTEDDDRLCDGHACFIAEIAPGRKIFRTLDCTTAFCSSSEYLPQGVGFVDRPDFLDMSFSEGVGKTGQSEIRFFTLKESVSKT
jgi:hypothetical protein